MQEDARRYVRQTVLKEVGEEGQAALARARVLVVGVGGLGCPAALYLAAAGVGTLGLADGDVVERSNLQRQVLFETADIGRLKVESARDALYDLNPACQVELHPHHVEAAHVDRVLSNYDMVIDGCDSWKTRILVNAACVRHAMPFVTGAVQGFQGYWALFEGHKAEQPCYQCLFPDVPDTAELGCRDSGVIGAVAGMVGSAQALLAIRYLLGQGRGEPTMLHRFDGMSQRMTSSRVLPDAACAVCTKG